MEHWRVEQPLEPPTSLKSPTLSRIHMSNIVFVPHLEYHPGPLRQHEFRYQWYCHNSRVVPTADLGAIHTDMPIQLVLLEEQAAYPRNHHPYPYHSTIPRTPY